MARRLRYPYVRRTLMHTLDAAREWLDGLIRILAPRPRPVVVTVEREPRTAVSRPRRSGGGVYRPLKG
jgi:hypothetical protein